MISQEAWNILSPDEAKAYVANMARSSRNAAEWERRMNVEIPGSTTTTTSYMSMWMGMWMAGHRGEILQGRV